MSKYFTYCFNKSGASKLDETADQPLLKIWGGRFKSVQPGDRIYIISQQEGKLALHCRITAGQIDLQEKVIRAKDSTPLTGTILLDREIVEKLRFESRGEEVPPVFGAGGLLDRQTVRGVGRLSQTSAELLDQFLKADSLDPQMLALSIRQPWAELILRGIKTIEVRSKNTNVRGPIHIYASRVRAEPEVEQKVHKEFGVDSESLPRGVLVGTVVIVDSRPFKATDVPAALVRPRADWTYYGWILANPQRATRLLRPTGRPQPIWFYAFADAEIGKAT